MPRPPRVLVLAEAANPELTSVPLVGWNLCRALRGVADVHVVTQVRNRDALGRAGLQDGREYTAIDSEWVARPVHRATRAIQRWTGLGWTLLTAVSSIAYYEFERIVWRRFGSALGRGEFDLVHRVTPLTPTLPSPIATWCREVGVPFVWGPINGGVAWPREFSRLQRREGEWLSYLRGAHRLLPAYRSSRRDASAILVGSRDTWRHLAGHHDRCVYIPENGVDLARFTARAVAAREGPLRVAFIGRLVPLKGVDMLLEAAAPLLRTGAVEIDVVGDGPERARLERLVVEEGLGPSVRMHGWVPNDRIAAQLAGCQVFAFPSIKDFGGGVVLEAMAMGLVPVVVDYGGPAELVSDATGFRVPLGPRADVVAGLGAVLRDLATRNRSELAAMGERARDRVRALFTWDHKAQQVLQVYEWVLGRRPKPDFGMPFPDEQRAAASEA